MQSYKTSSAAFAVCNRESTIYSFKSEAREAHIYRFRVNGLPAFSPILSACGRYFATLPPFPFPRCHLRTSNTSNTAKWLGCISSNCHHSKIDKPTRWPIPRALYGALSGLKYIIRQGRFHRFLYLYLAVLRERFPSLHSNPQLRDRCSRDRRHWSLVLWA